MPKINPDEYDDGTDYCDPDCYDLDYDEDGHYPIAKKDLSKSSELAVWKQLRKWGHPYINQYWDQEEGMMFEVRLWFSGGRRVDITANAPVIEEALIKLLDEVRESVFEMCNPD